MPDYDLSRLTSRSFEHLVQSLATKVMGPGIVVFGDGPDGGREATFERKVPYPTPVDAWEGYGVVQAKYRQRPGDTQQDGNWAVDQLKEEIRKYTDPDSSLRKPDYFIYATNVVLTPVGEKGSKDRLTAVLEAFKKQSSLRDYAVWDYDQIRAFLDAYEDVRNAYAAFTTPGDVLAKLLTQLHPTPADMYALLVEFLEKELLSDECVNLEQAGHDVDQRIPLATVFVDLPTHSESAEVRTHLLDDSDTDIRDMDLPRHDGEGFIKDILAASSERLDPASIGTAAISHDIESGAPRESRGRFVLIGGPGQGKTTLTQFLCQIFRASIVSGRPSHTLSFDTQKALATMQSHCEIEGINHTVVPRFPFKVVLNDFAKLLSSSSTSQVSSVFAYLARQIANRTDTEITAIELRRFLALYPSVIVFDGLDEVPASSNRDQVLDAIRDFWINASNINADILAVATTRPQGYNEDFSASYYQHRQLSELSDQLGWHVAQRLAEVRYHTDEDRKQKVLDRLKRAFRDSSTARLMRSPLQVTIMTALVDRVGQPPQARWSLFRSYYDVIYLREVERSIPASIILRDYQPDIKAIHNQVGLILQIDSERTGRTDAKLSRRRFVSLVEARLTAEGHTGEHLQTLAHQIVETASQRLVFLVEVEAEQIGFEIRSLQEFMAAESLTDGTNLQIKQRLDEIASIPFWRNVFLFAAGKCFAERQELREAVHAICASLNEIDGDPLAGTYLAGSDLAVALLEEGSSRRQPKFENLLVRVAIRGLDTANSELQIKLADIYKTQLESIFQGEIELRLIGGYSISSIGAWNCLLRLVASDIPWAIRTATENWPDDQQDQISILQAVAEATQNTWATDKLLQVIPSTSVSVLARVVQSASRRRWLDVPDLEAEHEAAISVLQAPMRHPGPAINVLDTGLAYSSLVRVNANEHPFLQKLRHVETWHSSWQVYKYAGEFLKAPSKESLASALRSIESHLYGEADAYSNVERWILPWPILACVNSCSNRSDLLNLAGKAARGELGDVEDWLAAETRWLDKGITGEDLVSMSDDRLPFDARIGETGFPTTLPELSPIISSRHSRTPLKEMLAIFRELPPGRTRSFVAGSINWLFFTLSFPNPPSETSTLPNLGLQTVESVYREVPAGTLVPLHAITHLIGLSIPEVSEFLATMRDKGFVFDLHSSSDHFTKESVKVLRRAYMGLNEEDSVLLPVLATLAENGQLTGQFVDVMEPMTHEEPRKKLYGLIITLSQETWHTDNCEQLITIAEGIGDLSGSEFRRIITTLERSRPAGKFVDKFVVALKRLIPLDDYVAHQRYASLLQGVLRKRTSRFADLNRSSQFALPEGIIKLLNE